MTTATITEIRTAIHHAATQLAGLPYVDQESAIELSEVTESIVNMCTVLRYQAESGTLNPTDFKLAKSIIERALRG